MRIPVGWMQPQAPIPLLGAKGKPAGGSSVAQANSLQSCRSQTRARSPLFPSTTAVLPRHHTAGMPLCSHHLPADALASQLGCQFISCSRNVLPSGFLTSSLMMVHNIVATSLLLQAAPLFLFVPFPFAL